MDRVIKTGKKLMVERTNSTRIQLFRYLFVGGSSAVIDLILFGFLNTFLGVHYLMAAFLAYMVGLVWNYCIALLWIFESKHNRAKEMLMVFGIALGGLFWTELLLWIGVESFAFSPFPTKVVVLWIVLIWNFGMRKVFVFH